MLPHRLAVFAVIIATSSSFQSFQAFPGVSKQKGEYHHLSSTRVARKVSASNPDFASNDTFGDAVDDLTSKAQSSISQALSDEPDAYEAELEKKRRRVKERSQNYVVTLPLSKINTDSDSILSMGLTLVEMGKGRTLSSQELILDSLQMQDLREASEPRDDIETLDRLVLNRKLDGEFQGILVNSVVKGSAAWAAGVRPGDILKKTSATLGDGMWPKSTLDGVLSAVSSRRAAASSIQFEFSRIREAIDDQFELTLARPIGLELKGKIRDGRSLTGAEEQRNSFSLACLSCRNRGRLC